MNIRCFARFFMVVPFLQGLSHAQNADRVKIRTQNEILYGAAYYNEYEPAAIRQAQLDRDIEMMKSAGFNVVRMGESSWSLWEPQDSSFEYAWMDHIVDAFGKAGIHVILGTPTYSIPTWLAKSHPEVLARPLSGIPNRYGMRQNMDYDNPVFRRYARRIISRMVEHYRNNPVVIGWQIDNETASYGAANDDIVAEFRAYLRKKFVTTSALNEAWGLNYWGQTINRWKDLPPPDQATNTGYKLEWSRFCQWRVTAYLKWQADLVRALARHDQFITQDFAGAMRNDVNEYPIAQFEDVVSNNIYHGWQFRFDGEFQGLQGAFARSLKKDNYFVTETNARTLGWDSEDQHPPFDGQMRLDAFTHIANGAGMVEYWHWGSTIAGQETYWGGVLSHDYLQDRAYAEVRQIGGELRKVGPDLVGLKIKNDVAILYSVDSSNGLDFMPFSANLSSKWIPGEAYTEYDKLVQAFHRALYANDISTDILYPEDPDFSQYKLVIVPSLYVASDQLLRRISDYVQHGGHVVMGFKSGFTDEHSSVRHDLMPGPLRSAAGFTYQEYENLDHPIAIQGDPYSVGPSNEVSTWAEFLRPTTAQPVAWYNDPFLSRWPALTRNNFGQGTLLYEGTVLSAGLQAAVIRDESERAGVHVSPVQWPTAVHSATGVNSKGQQIHFLLNYSAATVSLTYPYRRARSLLSGDELRANDLVNLPPWGVLITEDEGTTH